MTPIHIQWADDGQHIRKWARDPFAGSTEYAAIATPIADDAVVTISGKTLHDYVDRAYVRQRIGELMEEGDGFWRACCGCQESTDGCVSATDYPYNETFRCHPGSGCSECGGIGVLWDDGRGYGDITGDEEPASAPAGDGVEAERWRERWYGSDPQKGSAIVTEGGSLVCHLGGDEDTHRLTTAIVAAHNAALARPHSAVAPAEDAFADAGKPIPPAGDGVPDGMKPWHGGDAAPDDWDGDGVLLRNGCTMFPSRVSLAYHADGTNRWNHARENRNPDWDIVAYTPTAALARPRAAVGEREA
ncbi:hypothetical protein ACFQ15_05590 [Sphingomonas hankookensis]|uniref:hypothetical protein n=1 Tax=Sphingomonas hankookensis TaxID=563996 RepID=UPI001F5859B2|nr:hypothetical protein [Sphingomonas hankookensis]